MLTEAATHDFLNWRSGIFIACFSPAEAANLFPTSQSGERTESQPAGSVSET